MAPYYEQDGITIYHADARDIIHGIEAESLITDPVWPNCEHIFPGIDAQSLLADALAIANVRRVVVQIGCFSDPRFLEAVPDRFPFIRTCWLEYACPSYHGRVLNTGDVAYVFGEPPTPAKGRMVLPGKFLAIRADKGFSRWNWDSTKHRKTGLDVSILPHPTPRKLAHVEWLVNWFAGASVIDPFMGSGTTLLAAKKLGKRAIGIEINEEFCELAASRLLQPALLEAE